MYDEPGDRAASLLLRSLGGFSGDRSEAPSILRLRGSEKLFNRSRWLVISLSQAGNVNLAAPGYGILR
jgi:hypothetical protein